MRIIPKFESDEIKHFESEKKKIQNLESDEKNQKNRIWRNESSISNLNRKLLNFKSDENSIPKQNIGKIWHFPPFYPMDIIRIRIVRWMIKENLIMIDSHGIWININIHSILKLEKNLISSRWFNTSLIQIEFFLSQF